MNAEMLWKEYCASAQLPETVQYEAWAFGGAPDLLAALVLAGIKTGTASGYDLYALDSSEPMPESGDYSIILNSREEAVCVIRTAKVYVMPFAQVSADHAWKEGEGDRSLEYWRQVHWDFFTEEFAEYGLTFHENCGIVCEEFEVVYRPRS